MCEDKITKLKRIIATTTSKAKRTQCLWLLLTYHKKTLSTTELFSFIPLIWNIDSYSKKYVRIRHKIEEEIISRQEIETILKLLNLLNSDKHYLRFFGTDLLKYFKNEIVIDPLLAYLITANDDFNNKRNAVSALLNYKDDRITQFLVSESGKYKNHKNSSPLYNYLLLVDWALNK